MKKSTPTKQHKHTHWVLTTTFFALLIIIVNSSVSGQGCLPAPGGLFFQNMQDGQPAYYPGAVPPNARANAFGATTGGNIFLPQSPIDMADPLITTIIPTLDGTNIESVVFHLISLKLVAGSKISIYKGSHMGGTLIEEITDLNYNAKIGNEYLIEKDSVTIVYYGSLPSDPDNGFANNIRFFTGDILVPSILFSRNVLVWSDFIKPNSFIVVDDLEAPNFNIYFPPSDTFLPAIIAHFDENKNYVGSEVSFCIDKSHIAPTNMYGYYHGQFQFQLNSTPQYDIDRSGTYDADDELKAARLLWIINEAKSALPEELPDFQYAVWNTQEFNVNDAFTPGSWEQKAQDAVQVVPSPMEPDFEVNLAPGETATQLVGNDIFIEIPFAWSAIEAGQTNKIELIIPTGVTVTLVSGGTLVDTTLTVDPAFNKAVLKLNSTTINKHTIKAIYDNPNYYNIKNLQIIEPCDPNVQNFLHVGSYNHLRPFRSIDVEWANALPVKLINFNTIIQNASTYVSWETAEALQFSHFNIEKSSDSKTWNFLTKVASNPSHQYNFVDHKLDFSKAKAYYRLQMVDIDGSFLYSDIKSVNLTQANAAILFYPNPATNTLHISNIDIKDIKQIHFFNQLGALKLSVNSLRENKIDIRSLSNGLHFVKVELANGTVINTKVYVKK